MLGLGALFGVVVLGSRSSSSTGDPVQPADPEPTPGPPARRRSGIVRLLSALVGIAALAGAAALLFEDHAVAVGRVDLAGTTTTTTSTPSTTSTTEGVPVAASVTVGQRTPDRGRGDPAVVTTPGPDPTATLPGPDTTTGPPTSEPPPTAATTPTGSPTPTVATTPTGSPRPTGAGTAAASPAATGTPTATPGPTASAAPAPHRGAASTDPTIPTASVRSARLADWDAHRRARTPTTLHLPSLDLQVPVVGVGVDDEGLMQVPEDVDEAGWYRFGPAPGAPGNSVIAGHVDDREQGLGAFHRLVDLAVGDPVEVDLADGTTSTWRVVGRQLIDKSALEVRDLFRDTGSPQLVLVTCGGEFDSSARSYRGNVVVAAEPA